ncbi:MAG: hypothetical protein M0035_06250 [Actinomycetota bacterium]|nr:hypothetical protein [Actinomycetota bacterium]
MQRAVIVGGRDRAAPGQLVVLEPRDADIIAHDVGEGDQPLGMRTCAAFIRTDRRTRRCRPKASRWPAGGEDVGTHLVDRVEAFELEPATVTDLEDLPDVIARHLVDEHD